ncbi:MAG: FAD-dependent oxidoreductase [Alphaproteobacteria bacterium]|nr:FAD-dependent oxidoreductase [Alphaproteobacteria bacterium]
MIFDTIILGSGPAGFSASIYAGRAGLLCLQLSGPEEGGKLTLTDKIENYPGVGTVTGFELINTLKAQALETGITYKNESAIQVNFNKYPFEIKTENEFYSTKTLIIAMGSRVNWLNIPSEEKFKGRGISVCATCDGFFYKNKDVAVIGGGNTALYESLHLAQTSKRVTIICKDSFLNGERILLDKVKNTPNIQILNNSAVVEFIGTNKLTHLKLHQTPPERDFLLPVDGCFEAIGFSPSSQLFQNKLDINAKGYIKTNCQTFETNIEGVYACGDIQEQHYRQAIIASGSGALASLSAIEFLTHTNLSQ